MTEPGKRGGIVRLTFAVAASLATIAIVLTVSSPPVAGKPMRRMPPERLAEPRADRLALDYFSPLNSQPRIWRARVPVVARGPSAQAPVGWGRQFDDPFQIDFENRKRLLWVSRPLRPASVNSD